jgi:phosphoribosyl-AMP cyclohydrolase
MMIEAPCPVTGLFFRTGTIMVVEITFAERSTTSSIEEGNLLMPKFDAQGLITAVAVDRDTKDILMVAHMNADALQKTIASGEAWYWSRSRQTLWHKGDTSGQIQTVHEIRVDCDQDCLLLLVSVAGDGGCCHTGRRACFYRRIDGLDVSGHVILSATV